MPVYIGQGGSWHLVVTPFIGRGGSWHQCTDTFVGQGGAWKHPVMAQDTMFTVVVNPSEVTGQSAGRSNGATAYTQATPMNGTPPYTYAWTRDSGSVQVVCNYPSQQSTNFQANQYNISSDLEAYWRCTVTDAKGRTASDVCDVTILSSAQRP